MPSVQCYGEDMQNSVNISEDLLRDAQKMADASERTLSEQIEFWAKSGRALEPLLHGESIAELQHHSARPLSEAIRDVDTEAGRKRVRDYLEAGPFPRFEAVKDAPNLLRKIDEDGTQTVGKFVNRVFVPIEP
jgi:hypothetical protein